MPEDPISRFARWWLGRRPNKRFAGSIFDRFAGLEPLLERCAGRSVLDVGSCDGLVAYELARHGAKTIHGFERDPDDVRFARRLFRDVPAESVFVETDLAVSGREFGRRHAATLLEAYDVVLFLGVYHHLANQMRGSDLDDLVDFLLARTATLFAVRTRRADALEPRVLAAGFEALSRSPGRGDVGPLRLYERRAPGERGPSR